MKIEFWYDKDKKIIRKDLFSEQADNIAKEIFNEKNNKRNNPAQIRKFYDEVLRIDSILKTLPVEKREEEFAKLLPYLMMLNSKAHYAEARELVSKTFREFMRVCLSQIKTYNDFEAFAALFEAFMGFYKYYVEVIKDPTKLEEKKGGNKK